MRSGDDTLGAGLTDRSLYSHCLDHRGISVLDTRAKSTRIRMIGLVAAAMLTASLPVIAAPSLADTSTTTATSPDPYGGGEIAQAQSTGQPVVVDSMTTESSQVTAEPNGQFQLTADSTPVRAKTPNGWSPIDTALAANSDGSYSPKVTVTPVRFSGGGTGPLVSIGTSTLGVDTSWPTALPVPTVSGNTVTYPSVRPNVDLVLSAQSTGFTEALVVKTPTAASALKLNPLVLTATGHGVTVTQNTDGSIVGTDPSGTVQFGSPTPNAWDSSVMAGDPTEHSSALTSANALVATLGQITHAVVGGTQFKISVPDALLNNSSTVYPLYVDPSINTEADAAWRTVQSGGWNYGTGSTEPMRVGYCGWSGCTSVEGNARSYFNFNTTALKRVQINSVAQEEPVVDSATVSVRQEWSAESYATPVNLASSGSFGTSTTYPGPVSTVLQTYSSNCGWNTNSACDLPFSNSNVVNYLQTASNNSWINTTFALSAPAENDASYWKKFTSADTSLTVYFNYVPGVPTVTLGGAVTCPDPANPGQTITYVGTQNPSITAKANSYNGTGSKVDLHFEAIGHPTSDPTLGRSATAHYIDGSPAAVATWYSPNLAKAPYSLHVYASTSAETNVTPLNSAWSNYIDFTVAPDAPTAPSIQSFAYPSLYWGAPTDHPGTFNLTGPSGIAGFAYSLDNNNMPALQPNDCTYTGTSTNSSGEPSGFAPATTNGTGTFSMPSNVSKGFHTLYVWDFSRAHVPSSLSATPYKFYVAPAAATPPATTSSSTLYEAESLPVSASGSGATATTDTSAAAAAASGGGLEQLAASGPGASFNFTLTPSVTGYNALGVQLATGPNGASYTFKVNTVQATDINSQSQLPETLTVDTCDTSGTGEKFFPLGGYQLNASNTITVTVATSDPACPSAYSTEVDDFISAPLGGVIAGALTNCGSTNQPACAFNNNGVGTPGRVDANFDLNGDGLDSTAMSTAGLSPGATVTLAGATFTMPQPTPGQPDNVIAAGQTIVLPTSVNTNPAPNYVDLLVASTCGTVTTDASRAVTLNFTGTTTYSDQVVPRVTQWTTTAPADPAITPTTRVVQGVTMPTTVNGASATSTQQPVTLYVLKVYIPDPAWGETLNSVTLPNIGTDFTNGCSPTNNALHVFAITTSQG